jgi:RNA polymerase sigma-70 factor (ECF subfamily)
MDLDAAIKAVQEGDQAAFAVIVDQTERRLRASLALQLPDRELIDEVAHMAYITAYEKIHDYQPGTNFVAWLKRIAINHLHNECRRRSHSAEGVEKLSLLIAPGPAVTESEEVRDRLVHLQRCLEKLGPEARELIEMRYEKLLEPMEIGRQLGKNASTVRTILTRVRQSLLHCMEAHHAS